MSEWDRVERFMGHDTLAQLANKKVAIIGLGSGGGFVAQTLAMSGVGHFILIDDDKLELTNVVRHVADLRYLDKPKVEAVAELIAQRNPKAKVEPIVGRLEDHLDRLDNVDLVISGVDGERVKYDINEACLAHNLTAVYAGVYERGEGGDVVVIRPYNGPCYACWAAQLREGIADAVAPGETELDYGMIGPDGTIAAEPGLWLHVVRIASAHADMALNELLIGQAVHQDMPTNTVVMANVPLEIFEGVTVPPFSAQWIDVQRNPNCLVCGQQQSMSKLSLEELTGNLMINDEQEADQDHR